MQLIFRIIGFFLILVTVSWAGTIGSPWYNQGADNRIHLQAELYLSSTCEHCHKADAYFKEMEKQVPWLQVKRYIINQDKNALQRFSQLLSTQQMNDFAVPSLFFCDSRWVGFASAETTGKDLLQALKYCKQQIEKQKTLTPETISVLQHKANANRFDTSMVEHPSAAKYLISMAIMDAINPCALFCLGTLWALLFIQDTLKKRLMAGFLFIVAAGSMHFFQQNNPTAYYALLTWLRWPAVLVGFITVALLFLQYEKSLRSLLLLWTVVLVFMVQAYQQVCLMNWSFIFEQWLQNQTLSVKEINEYKLVYQLFYLSPLAIMVLLYSVFLQFDKMRKYQPVLNKGGRFYLAVIALLLIIYPFALSQLLFSLVVLLIMIFIVFFGIKGGYD